MSELPNICVSCRGEHQGSNPVRELEWIEPMGSRGPDPNAVARMRGWICPDCEAVHWAFPPKFDVQ